MNEQFVKRLKSFLWRLGAYLVIGGIAWVAEHFGELGFPPYVTTIVTLLAGEFTKWWNTGRS